MDEKIKKLIQNAKRRATMWTILSVLMEVFAIAMIALLGIIPDIAGWIKVVMGILIFAVGQGMVVFLSFLSYENDCIDELKNYLNKVKEYEE